MRVSYGRSKAERGTIKIAAWCADTKKSILKHMKKHWPKATVLAVRLS